MTQDNLQNRRLEVKSKTCVICEINDKTIRIRYIWNTCDPWFGVSSLYNNSVHIHFYQFEYQCMWVVIIWTVLNHIEIVLFLGIQ